jgi:hypothetical protein
MGRNNLESFLTCGGIVSGNSHEYTAKGNGNNNQLEKVFLENEYL